MINSPTWRTYVTQDLERKELLQSFVVPVIRLNRFNLGNDPVANRVGRQRVPARRRARNRREQV